MTQVDQVVSGLLTDLYIGGKAIPAAVGGRFDVLDPATGTAITSVAHGGIEDAMAAVAAAADAATSWAATAPRARAEILRAAFELMTGQREELATLIALENGKAIADARAEVSYAAEFFRWYAEEAVRIDGQLGLAPSGSNRIMVTRRPVGICVLVTPWNFPAAMATRKIGPALAAGCTMILKPASDTPLTALAIGRLLAAAGVPPGVVNVLPGRRSGPIVSAMLHDSRVRKLSFTGSTEVGRILLRECADNIVNSSMELGGNAPFVVFADADLDAALDGAMIAKMRNGGEACTAANRFYVEAPTAAEFSGRLAERMGALRVGPGTEESTEVGPLVNDEAVAKITTEDEAVALANDTEYGLVAYVYTGDLARGLRVSERIEAGMVGLNRGLVSDPAAPFGGTKQSGIGREGGHEGVLDYTESLYLALGW